MKKIFEPPFYTDYLQLQSILIIQSNWLYKMPDEFIDEFTYEIEADNAKLTFHTIGDEKIGDVILRLENELCQEEFNFFNVMSKSKTKSKSNWKINKETEGMLILKEKRKIIQYLKDHEDELDLRRNLSLDKAKNGNQSSTTTTWHDLLTDSKSITEDDAKPKTKKNSKKVNQLRKMFQEDPKILHQTESLQAIQKDTKSEACCQLNEEILKIPVEKPKRTKSQMTKEEWRAQQICWNCHATENLKRCPGCKNDLYFALYCDEECRLMDIYRHMKGQGRGQPYCYIETRTEEEIRAHNLEFPEVD